MFRGRYDISETSITLGSGDVQQVVGYQSLEFGEILFYLYHNNIM